MLDIPVLISGGGPVGLSASLFLSQHGVRSLLVERHPSTAITPKARGINARTMEVFRQSGIDAAVRAAGLAEGGTGLIVWTETLAGNEIERRVPGRATAKNMAVTPVKNCLCAQDDLEPVIRRYAEAAGPGELRFNTELTSFTQGDDGVTGVLTDRRHRRTDAVQGALSDRRRRRAEQGPPRARRQHGRPGEGLRQRQHPVPGRPDPMGQGPAGRAVFRRAGGSARHLPHHQRHRPLGLFDSRPQAIWLAAGGFHAGILRRADPQGDRRAGYCRSKCSASARGKPPPSWPTAIASATCSWPATPRTRCRRPAALGSTPACRTFTIWPGRSRPCCAATPTMRCSTAIMTSASRSAGSSPRTRSPTRMSMGRTARQSKVLPRQQFLNEQGLIFGANYQSMAVRAGRHAAGRDRRSRHRICAVRAARLPRAACPADARHRADLDHRPVRRALHAAGGPRRRRTGGRPRRRSAHPWPPLIAHTIGGKRTQRSRRQLARGLWHRCRWRGAGAARRLCRLAQPLRRGQSASKPCARRSTACSAGLPRWREA